MTLTWKLNNWGSYNIEILTIWKLLQYITSIKLKLLKCFNICYNPLQANLSYHVACYKDIFLWNLLTETALPLNGHTTKCTPIEQITLNKTACSNQLPYYQHLNVSNLSPQLKLYKTTPICQQILGQTSFDYPLEPNVLRKHIDSSLWSGKQYHSNNC